MTVLITPTDIPITSSDDNVMGTDMGGGVDAVSLIDTVSVSAPVTISVANKNQHKKQIQHED